MSRRTYRKNNLLIIFNSCRMARFRSSSSSVILNLEYHSSSTYNKNESEIYKLFLNVFIFQYNQSASTCCNSLLIYPPPYTCTPRTRDHPHTHIMIVLPWKPKNKYYPTYHPTVSLQWRTADEKKLRIRRNFQSSEMRKILCNQRKS